MPRWFSVTDPEFAEHVCRSLGDLDGYAGIWQVTRAFTREHPKDERIVLRCENSETGQSVAVKANKTRKQNRQQALALTELGTVTPDCLTVRHMPEDHSFFVMDWIGAPLLNRPLRGEEPRRKKAITMAGAWLSKMQSASVARGVPASSKPFGIRPPHVYHGPAAGIARRLRRRLRAMGPLNGSVVMLHGDFHPGNLFFRDKRLLAFDRLFNKHGGAHFDAAWFLCHLALQRENSQEKGRPWPGDHDTDRRYFFDGYGAIKSQELASFDVVEDVALTKIWKARLAAKSTQADGLVEAFGLLEPETSRHRPGRLVATDNGDAAWMAGPSSHGKEP